MFDSEDWEDRIYDVYADDEPCSDEIPIRYLHKERETPMAYLLTFELFGDFSKPVQAWLPKSQCSFGSKGIIYVPQWLVDDKELEAYEER